MAIEAAAHDNLQDLLAAATLLVGGSCAAIVLSRRAGLGTVLGLIALGLVLGPYASGHLIETTPVAAAAELGVILLLFVIGLEIEPQRLWAMRRMLFGLGTLQVLVTGFGLALTALAFGRPWSTALVAGFGLSLSSTAFVLQLLRERNEFDAAHGRAALAVLLLQDMMVVPLLALVPLLAPGAPGRPGAIGLPWLLLETGGALALLVFVGMLAVPWALALLARHGQREAFAALAGLSVLLGAWISHSAGLSPALGAFLLAVLLSRSPLHHQIAAEILPFKGLLLGLFFILIGMSIDLGALVDGWPRFLAQVVVLVSLKALILLGLCRLFGLGLPAALRTSLLLVQGGEFGFVLFTAARAAGVVDAEFYTTLLLVISASMALTPIVVRLGDWVAVRLEAAEPKPEPREFEPGTAAVVVGYGRVGRIVMETLRRAGVAATAVDADPRRLAMSERFGHRVVYGDAADPRLLSRVASADIRVVVVAVDRPDRAEAAVSAARAAFPKALVIARAHDEDCRSKLEQLGASVVLSEMLALSLGLARAALVRLDVPAETTAEVLRSANSGQVTSGYERG